MKKFKDIKVGDTVLIYSTGYGVEKYTVTYIDKIDINKPYDSYRIGYGHFGSKPKSYYDSIQSDCFLDDTSSTFGCYAATVYFNQEDVINRFDRDIKTLGRYKQEFINKEGL